MVVKCPEVLWFYISLALERERAEIIQVNTREKELAGVERPLLNPELLIEAANP